MPSAAAARARGPAVDELFGHVLGAPFRAGGRQSNLNESERPVLLLPAQRRGWPELGEVGAEDGRLAPPLRRYRALEPRVGLAHMPQLLLQNLDLLLFGEEVVQRPLRGQAIKVGMIKH